MPNKFAAAIVALVIVIATPATARSDPGSLGSLARGARLAPDARGRVETLDAWGMASDGLHRLGLLLEAIDANAKRTWIIAVAHAHEAEARAQATAATADAARSTGATATSGSCGAIPTWISYRESRCTYTALNASGAGGAYQLMPDTADAMARRIGHPELVGVNAADWPPDLQDAAATALWDGGAGACNWQPPNYCG